jgi:hypothetical protein
MNTSGERQMADEDEARIIRDLQAKVDLDRKQPLEVHLPDRGPYILPRFPKIDSVYIPDPQTFELFLETTRGQRVRVPIAVDQLDALKLHVDHLISMRARP